MRSLTLAVVLALLAPCATSAAHPAGAAQGVEWLGPKPAARPVRVISLAPSLTDTVVAMGLAGRLVGVTRYDDAPEVARLPRVGGFLDPSPEAILALRPDLVLWMADAGALPVVRRVASLGVPVLAIPVVSVADVLACARTVGAALGDPAAGDRLARSVADAVDAARRRAGARRRTRVLFVVGRDPLVVAGPGSYPDELLRLAGGENVVDGARPWPVYPLDRAVAADPALVVDAAVEEPAAAIHRLDAIPAVRRGAVYRLSDDAALRPGPRLALALSELERGLDSLSPRDGRSAPSPDPLSPATRKGEPAPSPVPLSPGTGERAGRGGRSPP
jgi:iron complex transport system substrate-binding protein